MKKKDYKNAARHTLHKKLSFPLRFFSKCGQFRSFLRIWPHLLKKYLTENLIFCADIVDWNFNQFTFYKFRVLKKELTWAWLRVANTWSSWFSNTVISTMCRCRVCTWPCACLDTSSTFLRTSTISRPIRETTANWKYINVNLQNVK